jgi:hypothetical protein
VLTITGLAALAGIAAGYAFKGRLGRIGTIALSARALVFAALAIMVFGSFVDLGAGPDRVLVALGYGLVAAFLVANVRRFSGALRFGLLALALGWSLNATVIMVNGGMPLSRAAYAASGQHEATLTPGTGGFFKIVIADETTVMRPLGDVIPVRAVGKVLSAGDLVLMLGLAVSIAAAMQGRRDPSLRLVSSGGRRSGTRRETALRILPSEVG